jgi:hypothetical protein
MLFQNLSESIIQQFTRFGKMALEFTRNIKIGPPATHRVFFLLVYQEVGRDGFETGYELLVPVIL